MIPTRNQLSRISRVLLTSVRMQGIIEAAEREGVQWHVSQACIEAYQRVSTGEWMIIDIAIQLWDERKAGPAFGAMWHTLGGDHLRRIGSLLVALGADDDGAELEAWLFRESSTVVATLTVEAFTGGG